MKLVELGTFALMVLFIGGMTLTNQERIAAEENKVKVNKQTIELEKEAAKIEAETRKFTISHDGDKDSKTVFVSLDAGDSFDAGTLAETHKVRVPVYDKSKPICEKWNEDCGDSRTGILVPTPGLYNRSNNGLFEDNKCECEEYRKDDCDEPVYVQECAEYLESCMGEEGCPCLELSYEYKDYVEVCDYTKLDHEGRQDYVNKFSNRTPDTVTYDWEQNRGPSVNEKLFKEYKDQQKLHLELGAGKYSFTCRVEDKYGAYKDAKRDVTVITEPNNAPEAFVDASPLMGAPLAKFKETKKKLAEEPAAQ